jgi:hypothetical protein
VQLHACKPEQNYSSTPRCSVDDGCVLFDAFSSLRDLKLEVYCASDISTDPDTRCSTGGFVLAEGAISWRSRLLPTVATSTLEAEYVADDRGAKEAPWLSLSLRH